MAEKKGLSPLSSFYVKPLDENINRGLSLLPTKYNNGSGGKFLGTKFVTGVARVFEGMGKYIAGTVADLTGDHRQAKYIFEAPTATERWDYAVTKEYNPGKGMKVAGDITQGIRQSASYVGIGALASATGAGAFLTIPTMYFSAAGGAMSDVVRQTGNLGMKEYVYGNLNGATEAVLESIPGLGDVKYIKTSFLKSGIVKNVLKSAAGEFGEEFASGFLSHNYKYALGIDRSQLDLGSLLYESSIALASGGIMGGASTAVSNGFNYISGSKLLSGGTHKAIDVVNVAKHINDNFVTNKKHHKHLNEAIDNVKSTYESYTKAKEGSRTKTMLLGQMWKEVYTVRSFQAVEAQYNQIKKVANGQIAKDGTKIDCYMNIDVKQNNSGLWFYSFAIEKGSRPADVLSVVTDESATTSNNSITESEEKSNTSDKKSSENTSLSSSESLALPNSDAQKSEKASEAKTEGLKNKPVKKADRAALQDEARKLYKNFDLLPSYTRMKIERMLLTLSPLLSENIPRSNKKAPMINDLIRYHKCLLLYYFLRSVFSLKT